MVVQSFDDVTKASSPFASVGSTGSVSKVSSVVPGTAQGRVRRLDIASQGRSVEEARRNLIEAIELFLEIAAPAEIQERIHSEIFVTQVGVPVAQAARIIR